MMISFRLSGKDLEWLESQQIDSDLNQAGELSLAVTAKRILLSTQDDSETIAVNTPEVTSKITQDIEEKLDKKLDERFEEMYHKMVSNLNYILDKRLMPLEVPFLTTINKGDYITEVSPVDTSTDTSTDTSLDTTDNTSVDTDDTHHKELMKVAFTNKQMTECLKRNNIKVGRDKSRANLIRLITDNGLWDAV